MGREQRSLKNTSQRIASILPELLSPAGALVVEIPSTHLAIVDHAYR